MAISAKDVKTSPAGINDDFEIDVMDINHVVENKKTVLKANNSCSIPTLSTDLQQGMSIKAFDGGKRQEAER